MTLGLDTIHWLHAFIFLCRVLTVLMGSAFLALLVLNGRREWANLSRGARYGLCTLIAYSLNVVAFTTVVLGEKVPKFPDSLIYVGWVFSFVLGYQMLFHSRRVR